MGVPMVWLWWILNVVLRLEAPIVWKVFWRFFFFSLEGLKPKRARSSCLHEVKGGAQAWKDFLIVPGGFGVVVLVCIFILCAWDFILFIVTFVFLIWRIASGRHTA